MNKQGKTGIPWCDYTWSPITGCNGPNGKRCDYCYMAAMNRRFQRSFEPTCHPERLDEPMSLKEPARIFVDSAGDLFDPAIPDDFIAQVIYAMTPGYWKHAFNPARSHTYIALTKQAARMSRFFDEYWRTHRTPCFAGCWPSPTQELYSYDWRNPYGCGEPGYCGCPWPLPHLWLGVTAESQREADERIPLLINTPAAVRFVSIEPLLGPVNLSEWFPNPYNDHKPFALAPGFNWTIIGNDSRPGRPLPKDEWVESLIEQCRAAGVAVFVKGALAERWHIHQWPEAR